MQGEFPKKGEVVYLEDLPDNVVIAPGAIQVTNVDIPVYSQNGSVIGKARVVEGDSDETSVLVELETNNPIVALLFKNSLIGLSVVSKNDDPYGRTADR